MYSTLRIRRQDVVCFIQLHRPEANNTINSLLVRELTAALADCENNATVVVLEGLPSVFCFGADFNEIDAEGASDPGELYDLWLRLATGSFISVAHVHGKANAGGIGFVAACDIVLASATAQLSLSELLFGVYPACVLPFLIRRVGFQRAHFLTLTTQPIAIPQAHAWGLVDAFDAQSEDLVRRYLIRLRRLSKPAIHRYKQYADRICGPLRDLRTLAVEGNKEAFSDPDNLKGIARFAERGTFPWEA